MGEELKRAIKSPQMWASLIVCFITLMGYSLGSWIGCILIDEWMEYRESALQLPFCAALAHSTSQIDDMGSSMMQWEVLRGSIFKYVRIKVGTCMIAAAVGSLMIRNTSSPAILPASLVACL